MFQIIGGEPDCDDCEVCRAMAKAEKEGRELGFMELKEAMDKQNEINKKNGIPGYTN